MAIKHACECDFCGEQADAHPGLPSREGRPFGWIRITCLLDTDSYNAGTVGEVTTCQLDICTRCQEADPNFYAALYIENGRPCRMARPSLPKVDACVQRST